MMQLIGKIFPQKMDIMVVDWKIVDIKSLLTESEVYKHKPYNKVDILTQLLAFRERCQQQNSG